MYQLLSIILPAYNEQDNIHHTFTVIRDLLTTASIPFEVIFVDDGSDDLTYQRIQELSAKHTEVKGISFSRNFGKESAIFAGLEAASGDCCLIMDCDLQHPAEIIPEMYRLWQDGYEVVEGIKTSRGRSERATRLNSSHS